MLDNNELNIKFNYEFTIEPIKHNFNFVSIKLTEKTYDHFIVHNNDLVWFIQNINNHNYNPFTEEIIDG